MSLYCATNLYMSSSLPRFSLLQGAASSSWRNDPAHEDVGARRILPTSCLGGKFLLGPTTVRQPAASWRDPWFCAHPPCCRGCLSRSVPLEMRAGEPTLRQACPLTDTGKSTRGKQLVAISLISRCYGTRGTSNARAQITADNMSPKTFLWLGPRHPAAIRPKITRGTRGSRRGGQE